MSPRLKHLEVYYLGSLLLIATLIGGGASKFLYTDFIIQILILPAAIWFLYGNTIANSPRLIILIIVVLGAAVFPMVLTLAREFGPTIGTVEFGRSLDSALFVVSVLAVFCFAISMDEAHRARIAQFLLVGVAINFAFSLTQFSAKSPEVTIAGFPFTVTAGFFQHETHLSSLFLVAIPFVMLAFKNTRWFFLSLPLAVAIALYQFVIGSVVGVLIGLTCVLASITVIGTTRPIRITAGIAAVFGAMGLMYFVPDLWTTQMKGGIPRSDLLHNTLSAVWNYLPYGSGFGTFPLVYAPYGAGINLSSANHVYNDYLELFLEGGVLAGLVIIAYIAGVIAVAMRGDLSDFQKTAILGVVFVLIHSLVDFPLRTMAMAMVFAYLNAVLFGSILTSRTPD